MRQLLKAGTPTTNHPGGLGAFIFDLGLTGGVSLLESRARSFQLPFFA